MDYENVYIARVAYGAKDIQTMHAFHEAEAYPGPSLIIAYSPCIAHGIDLKDNHLHQQLAVDSGHWPLFRYNPLQAAAGKNPLHLDSKPPSIPYRDFIETEIRFSMLWRTHPEQAKNSSSSRNAKCCTVIIIMNSWRVLNGTKKVTSNRLIVN